MRKRWSIISWHCPFKVMQKYDSFMLNTYICKILLFSTGRIRPEMKYCNTRELSLWTRWVVREWESPQVPKRHVWQVFLSIYCIQHIGYPDMFVFYSSSYNMYGTTHIHYTNYYWYKIFTWQTCLANNCYRTLLSIITVFHPYASPGAMRDFF